MTKANRCFSLLAVVTVLLGIFVSFKPGPGVQTVDQYARQHNSHPVQLTSRTRKDDLK